ncbi:polynucleotide kinase-phosphatase [Blastopirellula sp. JC732]|uniref:Polynucleotide kinase-phosphatase n=1 Tax=Blastopirellula sediminis TaxID=2894196 RepID=A0A9X1MHX8_9BACT|nr:polynucleotide kinase-phosphatase [Blastopirellula sediminis]MCC9607769.1 polynucleotide kinase-phosphatase [Blastopirellula sediminis]MCC9627438.1 polynucleotide kinase-phosphatase [Blastopirellula sediminis]
MNIQIPKLSLVVLIGPSGSGKSTFARMHFRPTEVLSSDYCRGLVSDDENDQAATRDAFDVLHYVAAKRLARGQLTVVDATNVQQESRKPLVELARQYHCLPVAIVLNPPEDVCHDRNCDRADRQFGPHVIRQQRSQLRRSLRSLKREGFRHIFVLNSVTEIDAAGIERVPLWNDKREEHGPFDIIGDVHGCCDELEGLLAQLGYQPSLVAPVGPSLVSGPVYVHPEGRKAVFVGDLVDRGPRVLDVVRLVAGMVASGNALCVPGNHDMKLLRKLRGKNVQVTHGLTETLAEIDGLAADVRDPFCKELAEFLDGLVSHYVLDDGKLVVAHAGMKEAYQGRGSGKVREFALYGETTGETDQFGLPVRHDWAAEYRGSAMVVYGHTPVPEPDWLNGTVNVDTGCVFGGKLTALRYPERQFISEPARRTYCESAKPFLDADQLAPRSAQHLHDDLLDAEDVLGKRIVSTRLQGNVTIREENAVAALEVMSRFAADPKWLIYLPPTMSPCETSNEPGLLEHPAEAFIYFRNQGVPQVVCQEKHMGSRAVVVVCRDQEAACDRFGVTEGHAGVIYTRTGRRFFNDVEQEKELLNRLRDALINAGFWEEYQTNWVCLDCELMPWSAKAQELLRSQYAAVGAAGNAALPVTLQKLQQAAALLSEDDQQLNAIVGRFQDRQQSLTHFVDAYRRYCWNVASIRDLKLAPFHLLATEGKVHTDRSHCWHMETLAKICSHDAEVLQATNCRVVDLTDLDSIAAGIDWWTGLTAAGGEGMVVKPADWIVRGKRGLIQPAVKCRGREYLRIIYSPDYDSDENLPRLRSRSLGRKRSLALREFALGLESLDRFVRKEPLRRVHECVFGVLALESEPVDPRL